MDRTYPRETRNQSQSKMPKVTLKKVRAWCRKTYGENWWDVDIEERKKRKQTARNALCG
jgi:hypothetical protein